MLRRRTAALALAIGVAASLAVLAQQQPAPEPVHAQPVAASTGLRFERVGLSTGVELQVAQRGPSDGRPVLFLHGYTDSWFSYSRILDGLPPDVRAIVPSQRGHGDSERPPCCYLIADFARDAVALLDALGIGRADVVGHSMGSFVAQRIAIDHPDRVDRLVLIGSGTTVATPLVAEFSQAVQELADPIEPAFIRDFQVSTAHAPLPPEFLDRVVAESAKLPARVWRASLAGLLAADAKDELDRIRASTLIVWGEHDAFWVREEQDALLRAIPRARLLAYEGVAHAPHWEDPDRFVADLSNFLSPAAASADRATRFDRVRLSTGIELQVAQHGPADGRPVLFLHGYTDSWFSFSRILDGLPPDVRAIVPSQRGHGDSERPPCCYLIADFARDAVALLDALGIERSDVVGHSTGSFVAQRIAIDHPHRVNRLVLIGSGSTHATAPLLELNRAVQALPDPIPPSFVREFQVSTALEPLPPAFLDRVVSESMKVPARVWRDALAGVLISDAKDELDRIRARTLILRGEHDALFDQAEQDALLRDIPRAHLITYPGVAHAPHWEAPDRVLADLVGFLSPTHVASVPPRREHDAHTHGRGAPGPMPLLPALGEWRHEITTASAEAQRYFDQGLRLVYAFNHDEAVRSFERAAQLDSTCAMCYWGVALALGPNINLPMEAAVEPGAYAAIRRAAELKRGTTALERALIDATAKRYGEPAGVARAARDSAYAAALRDVALRFPDDADAQVLFADAMLNLRPWNQWTRAGQPQPGTLEVVAVLDRVTERQPTHAGACHLYVHAVEASPTPERAVACAERLPRLMPGAGHVVHMPAHVYLRVGRYEDAARANIAAVEADARYFAEHDVAPGIYPMFYAPHNLHFLWAAYLLSGQRAQALATARKLVDRVAPDDAREAAALEAFLPAAVLTLARFSDWKGVLAEPAPPADLRYVKGMWHYARGLAFAGLGDLRAARVELDSVRSVAAQVKDDMIIILNPAPALLKLASEAVAGDIAVKGGRLTEALTHFRTAVRMEDALTYDEPPPWYHSARNRLGEALMQAGRHAEAETAFRDDLWYVRENGWSLSGLERALRAQGKRAEAEEMSGRFERAWKYADSPAVR